MFTKHLLKLNILKSKGNGILRVRKMTLFETS